MKIILLCFFLLITRVTTSQAQDLPSLDLDTLTLRGSQPRDRSLPDIKFDSVVVELYLSGKLLAVVPKDFQSHINTSLIEEKEMSTETYHGNKILLRIQMFVVPEPRKKIR